MTVQAIVIFKLTIFNQNMIALAPKLDIKIIENKLTGVKPNMIDIPEIKCHRLTFLLVLSDIFNRQSFKMKVPVMAVAIDRNKPKCL